MITLRKLASLPERTRGRKLLSLLDQSLEASYAQGVYALVRELVGPDYPGDPQNHRQTQLLKLSVSRALGIDQADWDLQTPGDQRDTPRRFPFSVYLEDLRSPFNVGSILRTAEAYGFEQVIVSPLCPQLTHPRLVRTAMGALLSLNVLVESMASARARWSGPVWALELGGTSIDHFEFPSQGLLLVGNEELGLSPEALDWADTSSGRVSLPLYGRKASLNVGVAFGIAASRWVGALF